jgi:hypothetical protein
LEISRITNSVIAPEAAHSVTAKDKRLMLYAERNAVSSENRKKDRHLAICTLKMLRFLKISQHLKLVKTLLGCGVYFRSCQSLSYLVASLLLFETLNLVVHRIKIILVVFDWCETWLINLKAKNKLQK